MKPSVCIIVFLLLQAGCAGIAMAEKMSLVPPNDPRQSITYWKSHSISADSDPDVAHTQKIFSVLLRGWDSSRLEPGLYVVDSSAGPWAASLADGNILLSREAIDRCMDFGRQRGEHLLAFVLAHELAHQRGDDLWHQRFFRMMGQTPADVRNRMLQGLQLDQQLLADMQQKEAQADHEGLILMASVGYDPHQILDENDFFTAWVENIWGDSCRQLGRDDAMQAACRQARARALRTRAQLATVATQSTLYELGVQAFVAGDYSKARDYFVAFARDYPSRAVISALGLTYLAEAEDIHADLQQEGLLLQPAFYYPLMLDASAHARPMDSEQALRGQSQRRAAEAGWLAERRRDLVKASERSIQQFEKAIRLEPEHRKSYLLLATAYLLQGNSYMVRGVLQGRYVPRFGTDPAVTLLLAMTQVLEGEHRSAAAMFDQLLDRLLDGPVDSVMGDNLLAYAVTFNRAALATFQGAENQGREGWQQLAQTAKSAGNTLLFRLALGHLVSTPVQPPALSRAASINGLRPGDPARNEKAAHVDDLWIEGEQHRVFRFDDGRRYVVNPRGRIISAWQQQGRARLQQTIQVGDEAERAFKSLGLPSRRLEVASGSYLAYDHYGLALHITGDKIQGWFLYNRP